jgi:hypothetical protein
MRKVIQINNTITDKKFFYKGIDLKEIPLHDALHHHSATFSNPGYNQ